MGDEDKVQRGAVALTLDRTASVDGSNIPKPTSHGDTAQSLREQAASCRRLSVQSRTRAGARALVELGDHFDEQARRLDPSSQKR